MHTEEAKPIAQFEIPSSKELIRLRPKLVMELFALRKALLTESQFAAELTEAAISLGYTEERTPLYGASIHRWKSRRSSFHINAPWWAIKTTLDLLMQEDWQPHKPVLWMVFCHSWLFSKGPFAALDDVLRSLPPHVDAARAREWFARFEDRFPISDRTVSVSWIEDRLGERATPWFLAQHRAKEYLIGSKALSSWDEAEALGFTLQQRYALPEDIIAAGLLDEAERTRLERQH